MIVRKISAIVAIAAVTTLAACGSETPKTSAELDGLLISGADSGVEGLTDGPSQRDFPLPEFGAYSAPDSVTQECKDALGKVGGLTYDRTGSAGKLMSSNDQQRMATVALYSSENDSKAVAETLSAAGEACDGQETEVDGNKYTIGKAPEGYDGVSMKMNLGGLESETLALVGYKGPQMVYVTGISMPADQVQTIFDAQMDKL